MSFVNGDGRRDFNMAGIELALDRGEFGALFDTTPEIGISFLGLGTGLGLGLFTTSIYINSMVSLFLLRSVFEPYSSLFLFLYNHALD